MPLQELLPRLLVLNPDSTRTSLSVRVGVDFADQEAVLVQQRPRRLRLVRQGLPTAGHPLHRSGRVGLAQAVPELGERLPQLFLVTMETKGREREKTDSMVINTYVSCLISDVNKHIIIHPVHSPRTLCLLPKERHRTRGPETSHMNT